MANTEMIRAYIQSSGYKMQHVARAMEISTNALNQKLQGKTQFKLNEAEQLSTMLGLTMAEGQSIKLCPDLPTSFVLRRKGGHDILLQRELTGEQMKLVLIHEPSLAPGDCFCGLDPQFLESPGVAGLPGLPLRHGAGL
mgnify:CR=1 FL=1